MNESETLYQVVANAISQAQAGSLDVNKAATEAANAFKAGVAAFNAPAIPSTESKRTSRSKVSKDKPRPKQRIS